MALIAFVLSVGAAIYVLLPRKLVFAFRGQTLLAASDHEGIIGWGGCCHRCCHGDGRMRGYDQQHMTSAEVIEEIGVRLARAAPRDSRVVLFGSHARGEADEGSDYDILVIEPEVADAARESVRLRTELGDLLVPIDVVVIDRDRARRRASVRGSANPTITIANAPGSRSTSRSALTLDDEVKLKPVGTSPTSLTP